MKKSKSDKNYAVGYKRPPTASQFQKGKSGNPGGRRKRSHSYFEAFWAALREKVSIKENGVSRLVTKHQAIWIRVTNEAAGGNKKARNILAQYQELSAERAKSRTPRVRLTFSE